MINGFNTTLVRFIHAKLCVIRQSNTVETEQQTIKYPYFFNVIAHMHLHRKAAKGLVFVLMIELLASYTSIPVFAYDKEYAVAKITDFSVLPEYLAVQNLYVGADESDISFPSNLNVTIEKTKELPGEPQNEKMYKPEAVEEPNNEEKSHKGSKLEEMSSDVILDEVEKETISEAKEGVYKDLIIEKESHYETVTDIGKDNVTVSNSIAESVPQQEVQEIIENQDDGLSNEAGTLADQSRNIMNSLMPIIRVYAAEPLDNNDLTNYSESDESEFKIASETAISSEQTMVDVTWRLDTENSSADTFSSEIAEAKFVYIPVINGDYEVLANIPSITVNIMAKDDKNEPVPFIHDEIVDGFNITIEAPAGVFPEGTTVTILRMSESRDDEIEEIVTDKMEGNNVIAKVVTFDITFFDRDRSEIEPDNGMVKVGIKFDQEIIDMVEEIGLADIEVFHIDDENNVEKIVCDATSESVDFCSDEFSEYSVVVTENYISGQCGHNVYWNITPDGTLSISGTGYMDEYSIYSRPTWNSYAEKIKQVVVQEGVKSIGAYTFYNCNYLKDYLILPNGVTSIGSHAFAGCKNLSTIALPDSLISINSYAFANCTSLENITIPSGVKRIFEYALYGCESLSGSLNIPDGVTTIGYNALANCGLDGTLTIPSSVSSIGGASDKYAKGQILGTKTKLTKIINNSDKRVELPAIENDYWVASVNPSIKLSYLVNQTAIWQSSSSSINKDDISGTCGPNLSWKLGKDGTLTIYGTGEMDSYETANNAPWWSYSEGISRIVICEGITAIGNMAFYGCNNVRGDLVIPDGVTTIGDYAFSFCGFDGELVIPTSVSFIGNGAFSDCSNLKGSVYIPLEMTEIPVGIYSDCSSLTGTINIPKGVRKIGGGAFSKCESLSKVIIPNSVEIIDDYAFHNCKNLTGDLVIPEGVTTIGSGAFYQCGFNAITIPSSVTSIGKNEVFFLWNIEKLRRIENNSSIKLSLPILKDDYWVMESNPAIEIHDVVNQTAIRKSDSDGILGTDITGTCGKNLKWTIDTEGVLTIQGTGEMDSYSDANPTPWDAYKNGITKIILQEGITTIGNYAFKNFFRLTEEIKFPDSLTKIGDGAFYQCGKLAGSLIIPGNVKRIGDYAFWRCSSISGNLTIQNGVETIGYHAFEGCKGFTGDLLIPNSVTDIDAGAFYECCGLNGKLTISSGITVINNEVFKSCNSLTGTLDIPNGITDIEYSAFYGCKGFTGDLNIPDSVARIGRSAFGGCSGMSGSLVLGKSVGFVSSSAFEKDFDSIIIRSDCNFDASTFVKYGHSYWCKDVGCINSSGRIERGTYIRVNYDDKLFKYEVNKEGIVITGLRDNAVIVNAEIPSEINGIPVRSIADNSFRGCAYLNGDITIPDSVTKIGKHAFDYCEGITGTIIISSNLVEIGEDAFFGCFNAKKVVNNSNLGLPLSDFILFRGNNVDNDYFVLESSAGYCYTDDYMQKGTYIRRHGLSEITGECGNGVTWKLNDKGVLTISGMGKMKNYDAYSQVAPWNNVKYYIKEIIVDDKVDYLGEYAFYGLRNVEKVTLKNPKLRMAEYVFSGCEKLKTAGPIGGNYTIMFSWNDTMPENAFYEHGNLVQITIPETISEIGASAFYKCSKLCSVTLPDNIVLIEHHAFSYCENLSRVTFPQKLIRIKGFSFYGCRGIEKIDLFNGVNFIDKTAFDACNVMDVYYSGNKEEWNNLISDEVYGFKYANIHYNVKIRENFDIGVTGTEITKQPQDVNTKADSAANFSITAKGEQLSYQWQYQMSDSSDWKNISGGTSNSIQVTIPASWNGAHVRCVVTDKKGVKLNSRAATINVTDAVNTEPQGTSSTSGETSGDLVEDFVSRMYTVALGRPYDEAGLNDWVNQLKAGTRDGAGIAQGFIESAEFTGKNYTNEQYLDILYHTFFDRDPDAGGYENWLNQMNSGASRRHVLAGFVNSQEFTGLCDRYGIIRGTLADDAQGASNQNTSAQVRAFVERMYGKALGRQGEEEGINSWTQRIVSGEWAAAEVAKQGFFNSAEYAGKNRSNEEFVEDLYQALFDRPADEAGKADWLSRLANGASRDEIMNGFGGSPEFANMLAGFGLN